MLTEKVFQVSCIDSDGRPSAPRHQLAAYLITGPAVALLIALVLAGSVSAQSPYNNVEEDLTKQPFVPMSSSQPTFTSPDAGTYIPRPFGQVQTGTYAMPPQYGQQCGYAVPSQGAQFYGNGLPSQGAQPYGYGLPPQGAQSYGNGLPSQGVQSYGYGLAPQTGRSYGYAVPPQSGQPSANVVQPRYGQETSALPRTYGQTGGFVPGQQVQSQALGPSGILRSLFGNGGTTTPGVGRAQRATNQGKALDARDYLNISLDQANKAESAAERASHGYSKQARLDAAETARIAAKEAQDAADRASSDVYGTTRNGSGSAFDYAKNAQAAAERAKNAADRATDNADEYHEHHDHDHDHDDGHEHHRHNW